MAAGCAPRVPSAVLVREGRSIFQNLEGESFPEFHARGAEQCANRLGGASLTTDYFSEVFGMDSQFKNGDLGTFDCFDLNPLWVID